LGHGIDNHRFSREQRLDRTVPTVADPAEKAPSLGLLLDPCTIADTLNTSGDNDTNCPDHEPVSGVSKPSTCMRPMTIALMRIRLELRNHIIKPTTSSKMMAHG